MILSDAEVITRLNSPLNLINRLNRSSTGMEIFRPSSNITNDESVSPAAISSFMNGMLGTDSDLDEVIPDNAAKIKLGLVKAKALEVLHDSLETLHGRLTEVNKAKDLSTIARDMKHILIDDENDSRKGITNIVVYKTITNEISKYDTVIVSE